MLSETSMLAYFAELDDPRTDKNQRHLLIKPMALGCVDISAKPDQNADKVQKAEIRLIHLVEARKDTSKMLELVDQALHQMAFPIQPAVVFAQHFGTLVRRNDRFNTALQQIVDKMGCRIASISDQSFKVKPFQQVLGLGDVVPLACGQAKTQRVPQPIHRHMDFGGEAASATPQGLLTVFFSAPAAQGWARIMVLSIMPCSISGSSAK